MRSRYIQNKIIYILSDYKLHKMREIAKEVEVSRYTVLRHIQDLSECEMIITYMGREGGVQLLPKEEIRARFFSKKEVLILQESLEMREKTPEIVKLTEKLKYYKNQYND